MTKIEKIIEKINEQIDYLESYLNEDEQCVCVVPLLQSEMIVENIDSDDETETIMFLGKINGSTAFVTQHIDNLNFVVKIVKSNVDIRKISKIGF